MTDRKIEVPKRERQPRQVGGFDVEAGALREDPPAQTSEPDYDLQVTLPSAGVSSETARPKPKRQRTKASAEPERETSRKLKVFVSIGYDLAEGLPEYARAHDLTYTEVLLTAVLYHSEELAAEFDREEADRWAALGLRQPARKRPTGRVQKQFYLTDQEIELIDAGVKEAGFDSRSAYVDELLRRQVALASRGAAEAVG